MEVNGATLQGRNSYSPPYSRHPAPLQQDTTRRINTNSTNGIDMYTGLGATDSMLARAQQLANADATKSIPSSHSNPISNLMRPDGLFGHADIPQHNPNMPTPRGVVVPPVPPQMASLHGFHGGGGGGGGGESMLEQLTNAHLPMGGIAPDPNHGGGGGGGFGGIASHASVAAAGHTAQLYHNAAAAAAHVAYSSSTHDSSTIAASMGNHSNMMSNSLLMSPASVDCSNHHHLNSMAAAVAVNNNNNSIPPPPQQTPQLSTQDPLSLSPNVTSITPHPHDMESDPRELEAFAEHFKQRRIKLGVTQADVGTALGKLKIPGVGSLSQSTICRFESLTLSHNNMIALKPVLQTWLEGAEAAARQSKAQAEAFNLSDKKRKRTSIAAPEKRSLEAYFAIQPRPSGEKIAQIAEKLDLKKNVVRVWFCNQRQKQKRMKFSATVQGQHSPIPSH